MQTLPKAVSRIYVPAYWLFCKNTGGFQQADGVIWIGFLKAAL